LPTHDHDSGRPPPAPPAAERTFWDLLPRRNFRRALFLLAALIAIIVIKRMGGFSFARMFDGIAPVSAPAPQKRPSFQHLEVKPR
jgi:hypothetical protein